MGEFRPLVPPPPPMPLTLVRDASRPEWEVAACSEDACGRLSAAHSKFQKAFLLFITTKL